MAKKIGKYVDLIIIQQENKLKPIGRIMMLIMVKIPMYHCQMKS